VNLSQYFDVDTVDVKNRLVQALVPKPGSFVDTLEVRGAHTPNSQALLSAVGVGGVHSLVNVRRSPHVCLLRQGKSDLYGPFWVCATLVFVVAVTANIASWTNMVNAGAVRNAQAPSVKANGALLLRDSLCQRLLLFPMWARPATARKIH
jgi:hypothetical protein